MLKTAPSADEQANLRKKIEKSPEDYQARYELAMSLFAHGQHEEGIDEMLSLFAKKRDWEDEKAKKKLLKFFENLGDTHPETIKNTPKPSKHLEIIKKKTKTRNRKNRDTQKTSV